MVAEEKKAIEIMAIEWIDYSKKLIYISASALDNRMNDKKQTRMNPQAEYISEYIQLSEMQCG